VYIHGCNFVHVLIGKFTYNITIALHMSTMYKRILC
jgi:hypothetical protein